MPTPNPFTASQALLRERFYTLLPLLPSKDLQNDIVVALQAEGKLLSPNALIEQTNGRPSRPAGVWSLLTLTVAKSLRSDVDEQAASTVAVAVECLLRALDLLDDVEDDDATATIATLGVSRCLNVSTALLFLSLQSLLSLQQQPGLERVGQNALLVVIRSMLTATSGQHSDILSEWRPASKYTTESCLSIAEEKAGSLMSLACVNSGSTMTHF